MTSLVFGILIGNNDLRAESQFGCERSILSFNNTVSPIVSDTPRRRHSVDKDNVKKDSPKSKLLPTRSRLNVAHLRSCSWTDCSKHHDLTHVLELLAFPDHDSHSSGSNSTSSVINTSLDSFPDENDDSSVHNINNNDSSSSSSSSDTSLDSLPDFATPHLDSIPEDDDDTSEGDEEEASSPSRNSDVARTKSLPHTTISFNSADVLEVIATPTFLGNGSKKIGSVPVDTTLVRTETLSPALGGSIRHQGSTDPGETNATAEQAEHDNLASLESLFDEDDDDDSLFRHPESEMDLVQTKFTSKVLSSRLQQQQIHQTDSGLTDDTSYTIGMSYSYSETDYDELSVKSEVWPGQKHLRRGHSLDGRSQTKQLSGKMSSSSRRKSLWSRVRNRRNSHQSYSRTPDACDDDEANGQRKKNRPIARFGKMIGRKIKSVSNRDKSVTTDSIVSDDSSTVLPPVKKSTQRSRRRSLRKNRVTV